MKCSNHRSLVFITFGILILTLVWWIQSFRGNIPSSSADAPAVANQAAGPAHPSGVNPPRASTAAITTSVSPSTADATAEPTAPAGAPAVPGTPDWPSRSPSPDVNIFNDWVGRYLNEPDATARESLLAEGVVLAQARRGALYRLIQDDPEEALAAAVPLVVRGQLPGALEALLEERVGGRGDFEVVCVNPLPGGAHDHDAFERTATIGQVDYRAFVYGARTGQSTSEDVPLQGIAVSQDNDRVVALRENPVRVLETPEAEAYRAGHGDEAVSAMDCAFGPHPRQAGDEIILLDVGGEVQAACSHEHVAALGEELVAAYAPGEVPEFNNPRNTGRKRVIMYRIAFTDIPNPALSQSAAESLIVEMNDYWTRVSYGLMTIAPNGQGSDIVQVNLDSSAASYEDSTGRLRDEAEAAAVAQGYDLSQYDWRVFFTGSVPSYPWCGLGSVGGGNPWSMVRCLNVGVTMHELGHNLGFWHGNYWDTDGQSAMGPGENEEYGDPFDVMGSSGNEGDYAVKYKNQIGWILDRDYPWVTESGRYRVFVQDNPDSYGARGLRYRPTGALSWSHDDVSLEFRRSFTGNPWMSRGLGVRWGYSGGSDRSQLVDTTPGSSDGKNDAAVVIGRTFADVDSDVYVTPVGLGNTYPESLDVVVSFGPFPGNQPPDVAVLAATDSAEIGSPVTFTAAAADPDGDELAYHWDFGDGAFGDNSPVAAHGWGGSGDYVVRCTVSDMKGGVASHSVVVRVGSPSTFRISGRVFREGEPVQGVLVKASDNRYDYTGSDGSYTITRLGAGSYSVTAQKYPLSFAGPWFSNPVTVGPNDAENIDFLAVNVELNDVTLVAQNAIWKYLDNGSDQGTDWKDPEFDDTSWASGPAELGYGDDGLGTVVSYGPDEDNKFITTYFRRTFNAPDPATITNLFLDVHRDDGVVVYLNGTEILRDNMPDGTLSAFTTASGTADGNVFTEVPHHLLQAGPNVLAAEIHQANATSSDIGFYARFLATSAASFEQLKLIYIASPSDQDVLVGPSAVPISVNAYHNSGAYTNVAFFVDGAKLGEDDAEPFNAIWSNPAPGSHTLNIVATDHTGAQSFPPAVRVEIAEDSMPPVTSLSLIPQGADWKYLDDGSDQGSAWKERGFDDATWSVGPAQLGYGDGDEQTVVDFGPSSGAKHITTYFRHAFMVDDVSLVENLSLQLLRDDGAVVYLNGVEVFRSNMPAGTPAFSTLAGAGVSGSAENEFVGALLVPDLLEPGLNVVAVEIHQNAPDSSDISFDFTLNALLAPPPPPGVVLTAPADGALLPVAPSFALQAQASPTVGQSIAGVTFYADTTALGTDSEAPYEMAWSNPAVGDYILTAVAQEPGGILHTSAPARVTVAYPALPQALVSAGSIWRYRDDGRHPGDGWTSTAFDDAAWLAGPARLGYGADGELTIVGYGGNPSAKHIATWFRHTFELTELPDFDALRLRMQRDDGALVYLNGVEVFRSNLPAGVVNANSFASTSVGGPDETAWFESLADASLLRTGPNVVAVQVHQSSRDSSDLGFDLELAGLAPTNLAQGLYLTAPADGSTHPSGDPLRLEAYLTGLADVAIVEYFAGAEKLGETAAAPHVFDWADPTDGAHPLTARVTYAGDAMLTSPVVNVTVVPTPPAVGPVSLNFISTGASWRYLDNGVDQGTAWRMPGFPDSDWAFGPARLGYGWDGEMTSINAGHPTTYYRRSFTVLDPGLLETLTLKIQRDDGAVVYLNGTEVYRDNLPTTEIGYNTLATATVDGLEEQYYHEIVLPVAGSGISSGQNLLAVEVHQSSPNSSDSGFSMFVSGQGSTARRVFLAQPSANAAYAKSEDITLEGFGWAGAGRLIAKMEFFVDGAKVGEATGRPFRIQWSTEEAGLYDVQVVATDSVGDTLASVPLEISVGFEPVTLQLVAPGSNWRYFDQGEEPGLGWAQPGYDDAGWGFGPARLGYGGDGEVTTVSFGPNANSKYITTYFRHAFEVPDNASLTTLIFRLQRDDGAVVWFDGVEAYRDNMPTGPIAFNTLAAGATGDEQAWNTTQLSVPVLDPGPHVVAVEVHQGTPDSSDLGFDLELLAAGLRVQLPPPAMTIAHLPGGQVRISWPATAVGWQLQTTFDLRVPPRWLTAPNTVVEIDGQNTVTLSTLGARFFRLAKP